jgi:hypothetical protein
MGTQERLTNIHVDSSSQETLAQLFDRDVVKQRVRNGFLVVNAHHVREGADEVILNYTNHDGSTVYATYPKDDLPSVTVADLIGSIPRDSNGPKEGAAFPVILVVSS